MYNIEAVNTHKN